jgi:hypothetical protein
MKSSALTLFFELAGPLEDRNRIGSPVHKSAQHSEDCGEHTPEGDVSQHSCRYLHERLTQPPELILRDFLGEHGD